MNLRDAIRMFGKRVGLSLNAVRSYSYQIFKSLSHLKKNRIVHADIKPDNILISKNKSTCKLSDFGNAVFVDDLQKCQEIVARFYRAPEIILGVCYRKLFQLPKFWLKIKIVNQFFFWWNFPFISDPKIRLQCGLRNRYVVGRLYDIWNVHRQAIVYRQEQQWDAKTNDAVERIGCCKGLEKGWVCASLLWHEQ